MAYEIKNAIIQRDSLDESFELVDSKGDFKDKDVLVAIDSDTLITIQLLLKAILRNDFKHWNEITKFNNEDQISSLFVKLGYTREDIIELLKQIK